MSYQKEFDQQGHYVVDISKTIGYKIEAYKQHKSQYKNETSLEEGIRAEASALGKSSGVQYAEWFLRIQELS